jgi:hypothetical protein
MGMNPGRPGKPDATMSRVTSAHAMGGIAPDASTASFTFPPIGTASGGRIVPPVVRLLPSLAGPKWAGAARFGPACRPWQASQHPGMRPKQARSGNADVRKSDLAGAYFAVGQGPLSCICNLKLEVFRIATKHLTGVRGALYGRVHVCRTPPRVDPLVFSDGGSSDLEWADIAKRREGSSCFGSRPGVTISAKAERDEVAKSSLTHVGGSTS